MAAPTAVRICGIATGAEFSDPVFSPGGPGEWDFMTRNVLVDTSSNNWLTQAKAFSALHAADTSGRLAGEYSHMYAYNHRPISHLGDYSEVAIDFIGRLDTGDTKKLRLFETSSWTSTVSDASYDKITGASYHDGSSWQVETTGTVNGATVEMTHGDVAIIDRYVALSGGTAPDGSAVGNPTPLIVTPDSSPYVITTSDLPENPWSSLTDPLIHWPYGWVLRARRVTDAGNGALFLYEDTFNFVQKESPG